MDKAAASVYDRLEAYFADSNKTLLAIFDDQEQVIDNLHFDLEFQANKSRATITKLAALLKQSRTAHAGGCSWIQHNRKCDCGADTWNAEVDAALADVEVTK